MPRPSATKVLSDQRAAIPNGILDTTGISDARCAYSPFQRLRRSYRGPLVRVRRSSDSFEADFFPIGRVLDVKKLKRFCGTGDGFVSVVYDQAVGSADHLVQTTTANQPKIIGSGELMQGSCRAVVVHDTTDDLRTASNLTLSDVSGMTGIISYCGLTVADKNLFASGTSVSAQKTANFAITTTSGKPRSGTTTGTNNYNLWDRAAADLYRVGLGAVLDRSLNAANEVLPIRSGSVSQTGWSQTLNTDCSGNFTDTVIRVGDTANTAIKWDIAIAYKRAMSSTDAGTLAAQVGPGCEGVTLGDSTVALYSSYNDAPYYFYTDEEKCVRNGIANIAHSGDTIANQKTLWTAYQDKTIPQWVIVEIGLNDMNPAVSAATTIAAYQDLIDTISADVSASCKICVATMTPAYERWTAAGWDQTTAQAKWVAVNDAIMGRGGSPITGVDARTEDHTTALSYDVSGNAALAPAYDSGDHIHPTNAGRQVIGDVWRRMIQNLNLL